MNGISTLTEIMQTPPSEGATLFIIDDGDTMWCEYEDGENAIREIAWSVPGKDSWEDFIWLINAAGQHLNIPVERVEGDQTDGKGEGSTEEENLLG